MAPTPPATGGRARTGSALIAGLLLVCLLVSASFLLSNTMVSAFTAQQQRKADSLLLISTESAANDLYAELQRAPTQYLLPLAAGASPVNDTGKPTASINNVRTYGSYQLLVNTTPAVKWGGQTYLVTVTGAAATAKADTGKYRRRQVQIVIKPQIIQLFNQAMFAIDGYDFMGSAMTDSYDSSVAPYALPPGQGFAGSNGDIGSKGAINVTQPTSGVHGAVNGGQTITLPDLTYSVPSGATDVHTGASTGIAASYTFHQPGTYHTATLTLGNGGILRVEGGGIVTLYIDGAMQFSGAQVQFDNQSTTLIIHQNDYTSGGSTGFKLNGNTNVGTIVPTAGGLATATSRPQQLQVYSMYSGDWTLNGTASMSGVIYAPNATFNVNGTFDFMGSLVTLAFATATGQGKVNGNFKFHYDTSLANLNADMEPRLQVVGWRSLALGYDANGN